MPRGFPSNKFGALYKLSTLEFKSRRRWQAYAPLCRDSYISVERKTLFPSARRQTISKRRAKIIEYFPRSSPLQFRWALVPGKPVKILNRYRTGNFPRFLSTAFYITLNTPVIVTELELFSGCGRTFVKATPLFDITFPRIFCNAAKADKNYQKTIGYYEFEKKL